jgi:chemotaxis protein MotB
MKPRWQRSGVSHDRWLVSYADFITLLFGFFVVLYAFAKADQRKQAQIPAAINSAFHAMGLFPGLVQDAAAAQAARETTETGAIEQVRLSSEVKRDLERVQADLTRTFAEQIQEGMISITNGRDGLVISLREAGFFDSGSATPKPQSLPTLRQISASLAQLPYDVRVEGHTDSVPIHNAAFDSNWELSASRAASITRLLLEWHAVPGPKLSVAGYGEFHPVASNDSPEGRAKNRRVDLVIIPRIVIEPSAPTAQQIHGSWRRVTDGDAAGQ